ncbi:hypothetical protein RhiJN_01552 [Ceratobasidium sp. AG-Ba]|nr:hypothetical protein RhiJN_01552 [Ceratobasidium sp. AG-Ba]QRW02506.1 hypothetical protein RhiLY_01504 [Ceratobasidium sp. AG-Ba]
MVKAQIFFSIMVCFVSCYSALPTLRRREVPQEHSHESIVRLCDKALKVDNPDNIFDAIFGLLDSDGASIGRGSITDPECVQAATADRAFTNAKRLNDVAAMTAALQYRTLERNTNQVGTRSPNCTSFTPVNPEIAALSQHQDPAAIGATVGNRVIVLELAKQIKAIGGNPLDALKTGTFQPGQVTDPTAKGFTCNDKQDQTGCIFTQNLLVQDVTEDDINNAIGAPANGGTPTSSSAAGAPTLPTAGPDSDCIAIPVVITLPATPAPTP